MSFFILGFFVYGFISSKKKGIENTRQKKYICNWQLFIVNWLYPQLPHSARLNENWLKCPRNGKSFILFFLTCFSYFCITLAFLKMRAKKFFFLLFVPQRVKKNRKLCLINQRPNHDDIDFFLYSSHLIHIFYYAQLLM